MPLGYKRPVWMSPESDSKATQPRSVQSSLDNSRDVWEGTDESQFQQRLSGKGPKLTCTEWPPFQSEVFWGRWTRGPTKLQQLTRWVFVGGESAEAPCPRAGEQMYPLQRSLNGVHQSKAGN